MTGTLELRFLLEIVHLHPLNPQWWGVESVGFLSVCKLLRDHILMWWFLWCCLPAGVVGTHPRAVCAVR